MTHWMKTPQGKKLHFSEPTPEESLKISEDLDRKKTYKPGQYISCDNISVNPAALEGETDAYIFTDLGTGKIFSYPTTAINTTTYIHYLNRVRRHYKHLGYKVENIRTDYFTVFLSKKANKFYDRYGIRYQSSTPYKHYQNPVERTIQTIIGYVAAIIHGTDFLRADSWARALVHFTRVHNDLPDPTTGVSPNSATDPEHKVDCRYQYRFAFGDLVCYSLDKATERKFKFSVKNDIGFYLGDEKGMKGGCIVYKPYEHKIIVRGDLHRVNISPNQLLEWYGRRYEKRQRGLPYKEFKDAMVDLLKDTIIIDEEAEQDPRTYQQEQQNETAEENINVITLPLFTKPVEANSRMELRKARKRDYGSRYDSDDKRTVRSRRAESIDQIMKTDDEEDTLTQISHQYHLYSIHNEDKIIQSYRDSQDAAEPDGTTDQDSEEISTQDALTTAPDKEQFREAVRKEVLINLMEKSGALEPVTPEQIEVIKNQATADGRNTWEIGTVVKCKRKKRSDGTIEKQKSRGALRGDTLRRMMLKKRVQLPVTFSPTIKPITFAFLLQLAVYLRLTMRTTDLAFAYLNAVYGEELDPIFTFLEPFVADICGLPREQRYRVRKYVYGLADSGRAFYILYKQRLLEEGYLMSNLDPCLFYRINGEETTFVAIFVDDTFIFTSKEQFAVDFVTRMKKHFEVTLDDKADSFLGIHFQYLTDGSVLMTQPKLLQKLFKLFPAWKKKRKGRSTHPYGPADRHNAVRDETEIESNYYLSLLGLLIYLTKSRPDILAAVSFGATKSSHPTRADFDDLMEIVSYLRETPEKGHRIFANNTEDKLRFICHVDASYLLHADSKGHTGYSIGIRDGGTFFNRSAKQSLVSTSSTHAEFRAIFTLVKDLLFIIYLCFELDVRLDLPAIIFEDNSAVVTITNDETAYMKKCKHFMMLINYVREQVELGLIDVAKILGTANLSDALTKKLRDASFVEMVNQMLGWKDLIEKNLLEQINGLTDKSTVPGSAASTPIARDVNMTNSVKLTNAEPPGVHPSGLGVFGCLPDLPMSHVPHGSSDVMAP